MRTTSPSRAAYNEALGATVNQLLFEHRMTRKDLADQFGVTRSVISRKLRGQVSWTAEELSIMAVLFDRKVDEFAPIRNGEEWVPAEWRPGMKKAPVPSGVEAGVVPPVGLEPTTFGLKVRRLVVPVVVWLEHADVLVRSWLTRCAAIASNSTIAGIASNSSSKGVLR